MLQKILKIFRLHWPLLLILLVTGFFFTFRLERDLLWDWDECLYAQYPKEMRQTGNFLINQWNGFRDLQKPPLYSWLLAISTSPGANEFNIRLFSIVFGLALIAVLYVFTKKYFSERVAILATLIMFASELFVVYMRRANTDIGFMFFIFLGVYAWFLSHKKSNFSYLAGFFFGLSVMMKGFSVIPYLAALFITIFFNFKREKLLNFVKLSVVFATTVIPWHLAAYLTYGKEFVQLYVLDNIIKRAQNPIEFHYGGRLFYAKLIYKEIFPWLFFAAVFPLYKAVTVIPNLIRDLKKNNPIQQMLKRVRHDVKANEVLYTIILLVILPLIAITRIKTKIAWYVLPIYPFLAIFLAYCMDVLLKKLKHSIFFYLLVVLILLDASILINKETRFLEKTRTVDPRYEVVLKSGEYPSKTLDYLVAFSERQAEAILPPEQEITQTFVYGGNPCAVYYSNKKVNYYYDMEKFKKRLQRKGLFLLENGDLKLIEKLPIKILFKNSDYTLFSY
ncbi:hypothetical protein A3G67_02010 [Candidatus Roizmanbacteria bacterium RIFCSPLOWO2_12_FULL_40_12]|uniref:Glycosyltransferase RgtA/B/C/D-like domain-containing protein n=1 Tax=Candidatus Roizmanbacteria bacterium RIFCSPLOWO2_01_FULL_40_42 TaxID=1802066 RepID=A0A1F7J3P6_9BACT|nr:MAG: hypothetical protein A2779_01130 [Candidatus Roizmanbacteria bacterium RIFCSPHIGHO2_01_FULL_40_98]OGK28970.1 MAG: hypothetical protein A3C31_01770 [Candidatus Roizmanbacteria bacterium RIFCSPHIGHO2_02_FULL_40_53]OGK29564.1 MAG: hypothetical protein A2W49_03770 [Candidatus Roizmanbacteria bacterium RIFCSPHIGHO2_12_41_18]OGK37257.1 MAG: hypothetical protein A3E69_04070 [Candidatus Roizmanbacteria bacterium RIFCSPHIGHO2_12_FULL_40_130]OGK50199.1 MAG: hypothetical protein A3B50_00225 [Candi